MNYYFIIISYEQNNQMTYCISKMCSTQPVNNLFRNEMQFGEILLQFKIAVFYFNTQHVQVPLW